MYRFNPHNRLYGQDVQRKILEPLMQTGTTWYCTLTFARTPRSLRDEDVPRLYIAPLMLNLARQSQSTITPFVGWWLQNRDPRHETHIHAAIHSTSPFLDTDTIEEEWKHLGGGYMNKIVPYDPSFEGLAYVYGEHMRRDTPFWEKPFTPPRDHKTGKCRRPVSRIERFIGSRPHKQPQSKFVPKVIRRANATK